MSNRVVRVPVIIRNILQRVALIRERCDVVRIDKERHPVLSLHKERDVKILVSARKPKPVRDLGNNGVPDMYLVVRVDPSVAVDVLVFDVPGLHDTARS